MHRVGTVFGVEAVKGEKPVGTMDANGDGEISLEEAYKLLAKTFDADGDGIIGHEEAMTLLERCNFFDALLTPLKVQIYFTTLVEDCNHVEGAFKYDGGIGYPQFERLMKWVADLKGNEYSKCVSRVVHLSSKICDKSSSVRRKMEVVFETTCRKMPGRMHAFEFACLCDKLKIYEDGLFCIADVHHGFAGTSGQESIDFEGFLHVLAHVGHRVGIGIQIFHKLANYAEALEADETSLTRLRMRMKTVAGAVAGRQWERFFHEQDSNNSGTLTWSQFYNMCRHKLHIQDHDNHLRLFFSTLDADDSGDVSLEELIEFVRDPAPGKALRVEQPTMKQRGLDVTKARPARFEIDVRLQKWRRCPEAEIETGSHQLQARSLELVNAQLSRRSGW